MGTPTGEDLERSRYGLRAGQSKVTLARGTQRKCLGEVIQTPPDSGQVRVPAVRTEHLSPLFSLWVTET